MVIVSINGIGIRAYAVMSNHVHLVLCVDKDKALKWSDRQVVGRWHRLHKGTLLTQMFVRGDTLSQAKKLTLDNTITEYRRRLHDISWLMRNLNEYIARQANKEDECTGRFWEERFKSQALLDKPALLSCMAYVDLNPIRTKIAKTPGTLKHTSIKKRLESMKQNTASHSLMPFVGNERQNMPKGIALSLKDYCELVDITGKIIRNDKAGHIDQQQQPILQRLGLSDEQWLTLTTEFKKTLFLCRRGRANDEPI